MTTLLYRIGYVAAKKRGLIVAGWALILLVVVVSNRLIGASAVDNFEVPGVQSQAAYNLLAERFPEKSGATSMVVFHVEEGVIDDPGYAEGIRQTIGLISELEGVLQVADPLANPQTISSDRSTAVASVQFNKSTAELGHRTLDALVATAAPAREASVQTEFTGELPTVLKEQSTGPAEAIGIVAALVILLFLFRTLFAMALPLVSAIIGLAVGLSLVGLLSGFIEIPTVAPRLGMMIGLGVGIDYALFVLSRHRDNLRHGMEVNESIAATNATAGHAVTIAGITVVIAILGLQLAGIPFVSALGYSASLVVAIAVLVAVTLLPALLGFVGRRILPAQVTAAAQPNLDAKELTVTTGWVRWAYVVSHRPWPAAIVGTALLLIAALPVLDMRLGQADAGTHPVNTTQRRGYDLLHDAFGAGFNGPLLIAVDLVEAGIPDAPEIIVNYLRSEPGISFVSPPQINSAGDTAVITVIPSTKPQDEATSNLVHRLRNDVLPAAVENTNVGVYIGGPTASFIDQSDKIASRLPWFIGGVVGLSFVLLMIVFRSILVPLKAALLNLLSIGAAYGVVVAVFQWGWGRSLIGLEETVPIASFVPMMMFAILFGLSMDYEVFILSRIREEHLRGHSNIDSVVVGLGATASVITAAALIMVAVFLGFVSSPDPVVKMMGVGLATAVAVDATVVRMVLLPATMALVGEPNWWLPKWLDRMLPQLHID